MCAHDPVKLLQKKNQNIFKTRELPQTTILLQKIGFMLFKQKDIAIKFRMTEAGEKYYYKKTTTTKKLNECSQNIVTQHLKSEQLRL